MGNLGAIAFSEQVEEGNVSLALAIGWHLSANHFPAIPNVWIPVAIEAIEAASEGDWDSELVRPEGFGPEPIAVWQVVEGLHLNAFISWPDED